MAICMGRSYFSLNMRGEHISATPSYAKRMVRNPQRRARAAIVVVARNQDCDDVLLSMARMEQRFNAKFAYPYVFLNNDPFDAEFRNRWGISVTHTGVSEGLHVCQGSRTHAIV